MPTFTTISGRPIERLYTADDVTGSTTRATSTIPAQFPYTRGIHPTGYRGKLWTMRQFAGFGTPEDTNARYKALLAAGGTGLSVAFDLPTLMGRDPDHELSLGEVGKCGVNVTSLADMETLFDGIALGDITTSMTINSPAAMIFAMYLVVAEQQGADWQTLSGTIQNDILKEFIAQKEYIFPPRPSMRLITDIFAFCATEVPKWNTISVSGYHIREAGATALQELAFTLRDGLEYVQWGVDAGLDVDDFVPRMSFFFNAHSDFFEEIAKYRAARQHLGARDARSLRRQGASGRWKLRFHTQTAGVSLTAQQPYNNVVRTALQALSAVLGGTNSLHTNSLDEALALPTAEAATLALRTQQIIAHESGVANVVDPLGGSYFVEKLTQGHGRRRAGVLRDHRPDGRHGRGDRARLPAAGDRRERVPLPAGGRAQGEGHRRRQRVRAGGRAADRDPLHRRVAPARQQLAKLEALRQTRDDGRGQADARLRSATPRRTSENLMPRFSTPSAPTPRSARCATRCATSGASTKRFRSSSGCQSAVPGFERPRCENSESSSPSRVWTATIAAPRSSRARCATPAWKSSTPACARRPSRSRRRRCRRTPTSSACRSCRARTITSCRG